MKPGNKAGDVGEMWGDHELEGARCSKKTGMKNIVEVTLRNHCFFRFFEILFFGKKNK